MEIPFNTKLAYNIERVMGHCNHPTLHTGSEAIASQTNYTVRNRETKSRVLILFKYASGVLIQGFSSLGLRTEKTTTLENIHLIWLTQTGFHVSLIKLCEDHYGQDQQYHIGVSRNEVLVCQLLH